MYYDYKRNPALVEFWKNKALTFLKQASYSSFTEYLSKIFTGKALRENEPEPSPEECAEMDEFYSESNADLKKEEEEKAIQFQRYENDEMDESEAAEFEYERQRDRELSESVKIELAANEVNFAKDILEFIELVSKEAAKEPTDIARWQKYLSELFFLLNTGGTVRYAFRHHAKARFPGLNLPETNFVNKYLSDQVINGNVSLDTMKIIIKIVHQ